MPINPNTVTRSLFQDIYDHATDLFDQTGIRLDNSRGSVFIQDATPAITTDSLFGILNGDGSNSFIVQGDGGSSAGFGAAFTRGDITTEQIALGLAIQSSRVTTSGSPITNSPYFQMKGRAFDPDAGIDVAVRFRTLIEPTSASPVSGKLNTYSFIDGYSLTLCSTTSSSGDFTAVRDVGVGRNITGTYGISGTPTLSSHLTTNAFVGPAYGGTSTNIPVSPWITPTLINNWTNFGSGFSNAAYCKDAMGFVHTRGTVGNGTSGTAVFQLPAGFRPAAKLLYPTAAGSVSTPIVIDSSGNLVYTGSTVAVSLDGISFLAEG